MLARSGSVPEGHDWALEVKFDGMRAQLRWDGRTLCLRSRRGRDCSAEFPELRSIADAVGAQTVLLDGELVCFGEGGNPNFERLRGRLRSHGRAAALASARAPATFLAFDLLHLDRRSTLDLPYTARRELLQQLGLEGPAWRTPRNFVGQAEAVLAATEKRRLEGVVAKRLDSPYKPGTRNGAWVKHKHRRREDFVITAWAPAGPSRPESFFLGRRLADGTLEHAGSVSLGLSGVDRERLRAELRAAELPPPAAASTGATRGAGGARAGRFPRAGARPGAGRGIAKRHPRPALIGTQARSDSQRRPHLRRGVQLANMCSCRSREAPTLASAAPSTPETSPSSAPPPPSCRRSTWTMRSGSAPYTAPIPPATRRL
jgi:ATP dependent DNA ligase domain